MGWKYELLDDNIIQFVNETVLEVVVWGVSGTFCGVLHSGKRQYNDICKVGPLVGEKGNDSHTIEVFQAVMER